MAHHWRVYVGVDYGDPDPDWVHIDTLKPEWDEARALLAQCVGLHLNPPDCPWCATDATDALAAISELEPYSEYEVNIDGDDYILARAE